VKKFLVISVYSVLTLSTLLVFWQVRNFDFTNYDDNIYVYDNPNIQAGITLKTIKWAFTSGYACFWHPLTLLSHILDWQFFGSNAGGHHLTNLIFHIANTLLLFLVLKQMTSALWQSAFVAALFALHPLHVESVAWVSERKDVLSTFFWMLTMWAYLRYVKYPNVARYLLTLLLFALGLMAKPMLVTLPFVLLLLDYWPLDRIGRFQWRMLYRLILEKIPFFALAAVSSVITFIIQKGSGAVPDINTLSLQSRVANAFLSYTRYIGKMFWPQDLAVFYPLDARTIQSWQVVVPCALLMIVVSVLAIRFGRKQKYLFVGWFWYLGTLLPVSGLIQVGSHAMADRYTYVTLTGLFIIIAWGLPDLLGKWPQRKIALGLSMVIVLTTLGICAHRQVSYWNNSITLFSHAIEVTQNNYIAHCNLGTVYGKLGRYQDEIEAYKQAIRIKPDYAEAHYNLGIAYGSFGRHQDAVEAYKQAIRINPNFAMAHCNLGVACSKLGRHQDAVEAYKQAIRIKPDYAEAQSNLGVAYSSLGRHQDAVEAYKQAIRIKPDYADAHYMLGVTYGGLGRYQDAIESYKQTIRIKPDDADAHSNLGSAYFLTGDKGSALEEYKILKTLDAELANKLFNLIYK
jgi:Flp pilus assembly protein TadD